MTQSNGKASGKPNGSAGRTKRKRTAGPELEVKIKKYALEKARGKSRYQAAKAAGFTESMAMHATEKIERPNADYFEIFRAAVDAVIPNELLAMKTREGLEATVTKVATFKGRITDTKKFTDFQTRARYIELAAEFKGIIKRNGAEINQNFPVMLLHSVPRPERQLNGSGDNGA